MNNFYKQPIFLQWFEAILLVVVGFYPAILIIELWYVQPLYGFLFILYLPVNQFTATPLFTLTGIYKYYSPMLLGYMPNDIQIDLHSGASFDYLFVLTKFKRGVALRNRILTYHLEGLLNIIAQIENEAIPATVNIFGTSYFFKEKTITKFGFRLEEPTLFYRINLLLNFIDLTWMYSLAQGKFAIPTIWQVKKASTTGSELVEKKLIIKALYDRLSEKTEKSV
jgi:hypothetical protein